MKISLNWIKDFVDLSDQNPNELGLKFTMASAEIEGIEDLGKNLDKVVTAKILEIDKHPDADKLQVTKVDNGKEVLQVVCGAKNIAVGQIVPLAQVGAVLPGDFKIKASNKRGVDSFGMLCSGTELGVSNDSEGILILPENTNIGLPISSLLGKNDSIIEIDNKSVTHRPDLWGHYGIGRELAAVLKKPFKKLDFSLPKPEQIKENINVTIEDPDLCKRYSVISFDNIKITDSPKWLKERLVNIGSKPINNVVDATNYVMFELGQPMHSFDGKKLKSNNIIVRKAKEGEKLVTLDDIERVLSTEMLVIADEEKPIALAGVMGNQNTEVDENTTYVVLESANFHPATVRRTALKFSLRTEASARFEKSLDPEMTTQAISRFYQILKETCPEIRVVSELTDVDFSNKEPIYVEVEKAFINKRLGTDLENTFIEETLLNLGFKVNILDSGSYKLQVPSYRSTKDINIPEDIVEEIGRIYGYDNIIPVAPKLEVKPIQENPLHILRRTLRDTFSLDLGFKEVYNYSFNGSNQLKKLDLNLEDHVKLVNPLSHEQEFLRTTLITNMIETVSKNLRNYDSFGLYELGKCYYKDSQEKEILCAMIAEKKPSNELFYTAKGNIDEVMQKLGISDFEIRVPNDNEEISSYYHPSRTAIIAQRKNIIGYISEIHPKVLKSFDITGKIAVIYINIQSLLDCNKKKVKFKSIPKYPHVPFDVSVLTDRKTLVLEVEKTIEKVNKQLIRDINLFDIYEGSNLPDNKKSMAFTVNFYSNERTLEPQEIKDLQNSIMKALNDKGYEVRG